MEKNNDSCICLYLDLKTRDFGHVHLIDFQTFELACRLTCVEMENYYIKRKLFKLEDVLCTSHNILKLKI